MKKYKIYAILMDRADKLTRNEKLVIGILCNLGGDFGKKAKIKNVKALKAQLGHSNLDDFDWNNVSHDTLDFKEEIAKIKDDIELYQREGKNINISDKEIKKIFND